MSEESCLARPPLSAGGSNGLIACGRSRHCLPASPERPSRARWSSAPRAGRLSHLRDPTCRTDYRSERNGPGDQRPVRPMAHRGCRLCSAGYPVHHGVYTRRPNPVLAAAAKTPRTRRPYRRRWYGTARGCGRTAVPAEVDPRRKRCADRCLAVANAQVAAVPSACRLGWAKPPPLPPHPSLRPRPRAMGPRRTRFPGSVASNGSDLAIPPRRDGAGASQIQPRRDPCAQGFPALRRRAGCTGTTGLPPDPESDTCGGSARWPRVRRPGRSNTVVGGLASRVANRWVRCRGKSTAGRFSWEAAARVRASATSAWADPSRRGELPVLAAQRPVMLLTARFERLRAGLPGRVAVTDNPHCR